MCTFKLKWVLLRLIIAILLRPISIYHAHPEGRHIRNKTTMFVLSRKGWLEHPDYFFLSKQNLHHAKLPCRKKLTAMHQNLLHTCIKFKRFENCCLYVLHVYSASMKSYHFWNVDILKIIEGIWAVTLYFVFLANTDTPSAIKRSPSPASWAKLLFAVYQNVKTLFSNPTCQRMPERYSLKTPSKWFRLFHQVEQAKLWLSGTTTWQVPIELNENIWCSLAKGYRAFICDEHRFL